MGLVALGKWASSSHEKKIPPLLIKNIGEQLRYTKHNANCATVFNSSGGT